MKSKEEEKALEIEQRGVRRGLAFVCKGKVDGSADADGLFDRSWKLLGPSPLEGGPSKATG